MSSLSGSFWVSIPWSCVLGLSLGKFAISTTSSKEAIAWATGADVHHLHSLAVREHH